MREVQTMVRTGLVLLVILSLSVLMSCGGAENNVVIGDSVPDRSEYPNWFTASFEEIARNFQNPIKTEDHLECTYKFRVIRSGEIDSIELVESSDIESFDMACGRAIESSSPLSALPEEFEDNQITITLPFVNK
jgi:hypothetical protein